LDDAKKGPMPNTTIPFSYVFRLVDQINQKSGFKELEIIGKKLTAVKNAKGEDTGQTYYLYHIKDYMIKPKTAKEVKAATILPSGTRASLPEPSRQRLRTLQKPVPLRRGFKNKPSVMFQSPFHLSEVGVAKPQPRFPTPGPPTTPTPTSTPVDFGPPSGFEDSDDEIELGVKKK
jgi:hypothetical protein